MPDDAAAPDPARVVADVTSAIAAYLDELAADRAQLVHHLERLPTSSPATLHALREEGRLFVKLARKIRAREWISKLSPAAP